MILFLTTRSLWLSGLLVVVLPTLLAALGPSIVRRCVKLEKLITNNEIAGFKFATIGVLYAVLIAFAIIVVWQKFSDAETNVTAEAAGATTVYRLSQGLDPQSGAALRERMSNYLSVAINRDWPAMERGGEPYPSRLALDALYSTLLSAPPSAQLGSAVFPEILRQLDVITLARNARVIAADGIVPAVIWPMLFGGAIVTIAFTFFFGTKNLRAQTAMTVLLSLLIFSELLIIIAVDYPFTGPIQVEPTAFARVLAEFGPGSASVAK